MYHKQNSVSGAFKCGDIVKVTKMKSGHLKFVMTLDSKQVYLLVHRVVWFLEYGTQPLYIDHINQNPEYNKPSNLRESTNCQNLHNVGKPNVKCTSRYKGVSWNKNRKKWVSQIRYNYKKYYIGSFDDEVIAAKEYDKKAIELHGDFAVTNFKKENN